MREDLLRGLAAPKPVWPDGARCVVSVTVHMDGPALEVGRKQVPLGIHSRGRYSIKRGIPRHLDILARHGVPATFFMCGYDAEIAPGLMREVHAAGHEIAAHGYVHEGWDLGDAEPELLERTHNILSDCVGEAPVGWCSPSGRKSALTLPTLRRLGYIYDASEKDDDTPYLATVGDTVSDQMIVLPNNTVSLDDVPAYREGQALAAEVLENWIQELHAIHAGAGYLHLTYHPRSGFGSGIPARAAVVDAFLAEARRLPGVHFCTLKDLARHCLAQPQEWAR
ncbi:polysaccharide deacetylase [Rhodovarius crocodyli]|uniref:Chitooligosaccharide deacetylase n=1 Tax=Rhodovarius crocodyli TaxID=1979269 RepID=A0A437MMR8_9PROT|nr:polysaccharide deacetylase family protein [Rhodovarius crocodyli]RVT98910.1 polysaccharide deacetylase [Rhodovarius crocodyli]